MLTKSDLDQLRNVVREEVENETSAVKNSLDGTIRQARIMVQQDFRDLKDRIKNVEIKITKNLREVKQELAQVVDFLDKENLKTVKRVKKIETQLGITN